MRIGVFRRQVTLLFVLLIVAQAIVLILLYSRIRDFIALRTDLRETEQLRTELQGLRAAVTDAESGQRGFVITGQEELLQTYRASILTFQPRLERVRQLTANKPELQRQAVSLSSLVSAVRENLERLVEVRRHEGFAAAQGILSSGAQREQMDQLRDLTRELDELEQRRGRAQEQSHLHASSALITLAFLGLCGSMLLAMGLGLFILARLGAIGAPLGMRMVELARELRSAAKAAQRDAVALASLSQSNALTKAEGQATLEVVTRMAKDLSMLAMEITASVQVLTEEPDSAQKKLNAAELDRVVTLAGRVAQSALSIELTTTEQRRLLDGASAFEMQLEQSVKSVEQTASRAKQTSKDLVELVQQLPGPESLVHSASATADGSHIEIAPIGN